MEQSLSEREEQLQQTKQQFLQTQSQLENNIQQLTTTLATTQRAQQDKTSTDVVDSIDLFKMIWQELKQKIQN